MDRDAVAAWDASILDSAPGIYFMFDAQGRLARWNRPYLETFGLAQADLAHYHALAPVPPDQLDKAQRAIARVLAGEQVTLELDLLVADGTRRTFYGTGVPVWLDGRPHVASLAVDITERKRAEEAARRGQEILACVGRLLSLYVDDNEAGTLFASALEDILRLAGSQYGFVAELCQTGEGACLRSLAIAGFTATDPILSEANGFCLRDLNNLVTAAVHGRAPVIANDPAHDPRGGHRLPPGHPPLEAFLGLPLTRGGEVVGCIGLANRAGGYDLALVEELAPVVEAVAQLIAAWRNAQARRQAEAALREQERELDSIVENIPNMIFVKDAETLRFVRFNRAGEAMIGIPREAVLGRSDYDLVAREEADFYTACDRAVLASHEPLDIPEESNTTPSGTRILHTRKVCIRDEDGQPRYLLGIAEDITERKRQADFLRMYERMVSCMPDHLSVLGRDYRYLVVNDTYVRNHGLPREEIIGHTVAELLGQAVFDTLVKPNLDRCLAGEQVHYRDWFELRIAGRRFMDVTYTPFLDGHGHVAGVIVASRDLTELEQAHQALVDSERRFHLLVDQAADAFFIADLDGRIHDVNQRACDSLGYTKAELLALGVLDVEQDFDLASARTLWHGLQPGQLITLQGRHRRKDGSVFPVEVRVSCLDLQGQRLMAALARDISERHQAEERLRQAAAVFDNAQEGIVITDRDTRILAVNQAFCEISGCTERDVLGKTPALFKSGRHDAAFYRDLWATLLRTGRWQGEVWDRRLNGEIFPKWLSISAVRDASGDIVRYVALFADISRLKESEQRLEHLAHFDPLTDLPNRLLFNSRLEHALDRAKRHGQRIAVLFLDLDRFKTVNDSLGHPAGDELLVAVARRIRGRLRDEDTLARLGGDEFIILLELLDEVRMAAVVAQDLLQVLSAPIQLSGGHEVFIGGSIGISLYPDDAGETMQLVRNADAALYQAKEQGRNTYRFYTEALTHQAKARLDMEASLRRALEREEFVLYYQPQVAVADGRIIGVEALLRWRHPVEGLVSPAEFIPIAEETGLIVPLGEWVLTRACAQMKSWLAQGLTPMSLAVNLSSRQFQDSDLAGRVGDVLQRTGLPPHLLELELTESAIMEQGGQAIAIVHALKALGVRLAIDDFGTGYSSLAYLKRFAVDTLKIDRSFVRDIPDDQNDMEIAASIIAMAHNLQLQVLAEGVETQAQLAYLRHRGCNAYQGYLFSRPLPAEELEGVLGVEQAPARR